jgi:hypothetical protein
VVLKSPAGHGGRVARGPCPAVAAIGPDGPDVRAAACDNVAEPLAWMLRPGSAGSNTAADHLRLLGEAITALPPALRRRLMVTCDGAGASHALVQELDRLGSRHGYRHTRA